MKRSVEKILRGVRELAHDIAALLAILPYVTVFISGASHIPMDHPELKLANQEEVQSAYTVGR